MSLLTRYFLRNNLFLILSILLIGTGMYLLTDLFDRLDNFLDAGLGFAVIAGYFAVKTPLIISQILPAVFLIAVIVQFTLMNRSRELVALQAGGISPLVFLRFVIVYGILWSLVQLSFSQVLGVYGERTAGAIWREQVRGRERDQAEVRGVWFTDKSYVVHLGVAYPAMSRGEDLLAYRLSADGNDLEEIVRADTFSVDEAGWHLQGVTLITPASFGHELRLQYSLPLSLDLAAFKAFEPGNNPSLLPVWELGRVISQLESTGSNVEVLRTVYHNKWAYAFSLVVMGIIGLALTLWRENIYICIGSGLLVTFLFYAAATLFTSLGERALLPPVIAGWGANALFLSAGLAAVLSRIRPRLRLGRQF